MEFESMMRISFNGRKNLTNSNPTKISSEFQYKSPISLSSGTDESSGSTDEDIIKLAKDLTNTFGILEGDSDQPPPFSDVIFRVRGRRFFASKIMLVSRSEYFKAMFTGTMKESTVKEVTLEGVDPDVFFIVLKYICIGILDLDYDHRMVGSIYQYCDLLGLTRGKELSLGMMTRIATMYIQKPDVENALVLWDSINRSLIPCEDVHPHLRAFVLQYSSLVFYTETFFTICEKTVCDMLRNDGLRMEELDILDCVVEWCRLNSSSNVNNNNVSTSNGGKDGVGGGGGTHSYGTLKRHSASYGQDRRRHEDAESNGSCSSSRCSSRRGSIHNEKETAFERLDQLKILPDKDITNILRGISRSNRGESFQFLGYHYRRPRNTRKRAYPIEFLLAMTQPFDAKVSNELIPLNSFSSEYGQSTNQFLYRVKKDIKLPANLERFTFKDRDFFVQLKEREKGQLAVYLAFGSKLTKPLAISVMVSIIGFRFQDSIEFSYKKLFEEGFDSAWGWPRFISLESLQKDKYSHYSDSFCLLIELTSQWG
eukprot:gene2056-2535_t